MAITGKKPSELDATTVTAFKTKLDINKGSLYAGIATPTGTPVSSGKVYYTASQSGTYTNYGGLTLDNENALLNFSEGVWSKTTLSTKLKSPGVITGKVVSGFIYTKTVVNGANTERWIVVLPYTRVKMNTPDGKHISITSGEYLISSVPTTGSASSTLVWCTVSGYTGTIGGSTLAVYNDVPEFPVGENYVFIGMSLILNSYFQGATYSEYNHMFYLTPFHQSNHVAGCSGNNAILLNPEDDNTPINIYDYGFRSIESSVTGYNYVKRAITTTTPVLTDKNYYVARCEAGTTTFTNFLNGVTPYEVTFSSTTAIALKYDVATGWSHTVLPYIDDISAGKILTVFRYKDIIIPNGTFLFSSFFYNAKYVTGQSREQSKIMYFGTSFSDGWLRWSVYRNITFYNPLFSDYYRQVPLEIHDCHIICEDEIVDSSSRYLMILGFNNRTIYYNHKFTNTIFNYDSLYTCIWGDMIAHIDIIGCRFEGNSISHPIRINNCTNGAEVAYNYVNGGTTGIFFGSQRYAPIENINVHNNECLNQREESISFDGFGNNEGLCPIICNGLITAKSNDINGKLVIQAAMKYTKSGVPNTDHPISLRSDWTNFYFAFESSTGAEGVLCKIDDYDSVADTLTLDCFIDESDISLGGFVSVHSGFFNCSIKNNIIHHTYGNSYSYATGISIWLNSFNFDITGNKVYGCAHGFSCAGGLMLSTYHSLTWGNNISDNVFMNCKEYVGWFQSAYTDTFYQYNNRFTNNIISNCNELYIDNQANFIYEGNQLDNTVVIRSYLLPTSLPTADSSHIGKTFTLYTTDGSGNITDIVEYRCRLDSGVYSWVEIT